MSPLLKNIAGPIKSLHITGSPPPRKISPADNLPVKIRLAWAAAGRVDFGRKIVGQGRLFGGDPIMGHRLLGRMNSSI